MPARLHFPVIPRADTPELDPGTGLPPAEETRLDERVGPGHTRLPLAVAGSRSRFRRATDCCCGLKIPSSWVQSRFSSFAIAPGTA